MGTTPNYNIPTPNDGDAWDLVTDLDALALATDTAIKGVADSSKNASNITSGTLAVANGGTGATVSRTILQVVTDTTTAEVGNATTTFVTTGLSISFTPKRSDSTILIFYSLNGIRKIGDSYTRAEVQLWRDSSVAQYSISGLGLELATGAFLSASAIHVETSGSTAARTYDVRFARTATGTIYMQYQPATTSTMTIFEVAP